MSLSKRAQLLAGLVLAMASPAAVLGDTGEAGWKPVSSDRLRNPEPGDWASYRRSYDATGFSPLDQINKATVDGLRPVWSFGFKDNSRWAPTPIAVNGLLYVAQGTGRVTAFDAATGDVVWVHERSFPEDISISQGYPRARGVAVYGNMIYWGTADSYLLALDAQTGKLIWQIKTGDYHTGDGHNHPPLIADGKVFIGHTGGDRTAKGRFRAYDAMTGKLLWTIRTAPEPGDPGYETWPNRAKYPPMGVVPWNTISYDPQLRLVYFGTGQPTPWTEPTRGVGKALYSNSILAVDPDTGKIVWHFQVNPNDNWDRDSVFESMLVDLPVGGAMRKVLIHTGKTGWGVVLDRTDGKFISAFRTGYENVITGWTKDGTPISDPQFALKATDVGSTKNFIVCPHLHGGRDLNAASFSPLTRLYYLGFNNTCLKTPVHPEVFQEGHSMAGTSGPAIRAPGYNYVGELTAYNPINGTRAWSYQAPGGHAMSASVLATAGGLVFGGTIDRQFFALDADNGKLLWQTRLSGDVSGAPVAFEVAGRQYIAIGAGGRPAQTASFSGLTNATLPDGGGVVTVFALPDKRDYLPSPRAGVAPTISKSETPEAAIKTVAVKSPTSPAPSGGGPAYYTEAQAARGQKVFQTACITCHAIADHTGTTFRTKWGQGSVANLYNFISVAMPEKAPGSLPKTDYADVIAFLLSRSGYPAGKTEIPANPAALEAMLLNK